MMDTDTDTVVVPITSSSHAPFKIYELFFFQPTSITLHFLSRDSLYSQPHLPFHHATTLTLRTLPFFSTHPPIFHVFLVLHPH